MASEVELANYALALVEEESIAAMTDTSTRAKLVNRMFTPALRSVLRAHPWNAALALSSLSAATTPTHTWSYAFTLPTDCLRVLALNDDPEDGEPGDYYEIAGRTLLTNTSAANIRYIKLITSYADFDSLLYVAFGARLAAALAYALHPSKANDLESRYQLALKEARSTDGSEGSPRRISTNALTDIR